MPRPLGKHQIALLKVLDEPSLHRERGFWASHVGWTWGTATNTARLCNQLVARGLMTASPTGNKNDFPEYRLTPEGEATIQKLKANNWITPTKP
jgi:hypothetical protein